MKTYLVKATLKFPSCNHSGYEFEIYARNKAAAIKSARSQVWNEGHTRQDGPLTFTASEVD